MPPTPWAARPPAIGHLVCPPPPAISRDSRLPTPPIWRKAASPPLAPAFLSYLGKHGPGYNKWFQMSSEDDLDAPLRENAQPGGSWCPEHPQNGPLGMGPETDVALWVPGRSPSRALISPPVEGATAGLCLRRPDSGHRPRWFGINLSRFSSTWDVGPHFLQPRWPPGEAGLPGRGVTL